jgi:hypothetical protein
LTKYFDVLEFLAEKKQNQQVKKIIEIVEGNIKNNIDLSELIKTKISELKLKMPKTN